MIIQPFRRNAIYHLTERQSFLISDINIQFCHPMQNNMIRISLSRFRTILPENIIKYINRLFQNMIFRTSVCSSTTVCRTVSLNQIKRIIF